MPCPRAFMCEGKQADKVACIIKPGWFLPRTAPEGASTCDAVRKCPANYYCPGGDVAKAYCACAPGNFCPEGSVDIGGEACPAGLCCPGGHAPPAECKKQSPAPPVSPSPSPSPPPTDAGNGPQESSEKVLLRT